MPTITSTAKVPSGFRRASRLTRAGSPMLGAMPAASGARATSSERVRVPVNAVITKPFL
jgi:hypothetical protein